MVESYFAMGLGWSIHDKECGNNVCRTFLRREATAFKIVWESFRRILWLPQIRFSVPGNDFVWTFSMIPEPSGDFPCMVADTVSSSPRVVHASASSIVWGSSVALSG